MACHREWKNFLGKRAQKPVGIIKELQEFARCDNFRKRLPSRLTPPLEKQQEQIYLLSDKFDVSDIFFSPCDSARSVHADYRERTSRRKIRAACRSAASSRLDSSERLNDVQSRGTDCGQEAAEQPHQQRKAQ
jgi:hypothetical protein